jgi:hypothetical protein
MLRELSVYELVDSCPPLAVRSVIPGLRNLQLRRVLELSELSTIQSSIETIAITYNYSFP